MAESSSGADLCTVTLQLCLETEKELSSDGIKDIAKELKNDLTFLQTHISKEKKLRFVHVTDVTCKNELIFITFEFKDEAALTAFYESTAVDDNELSKSLTTYFYDQTLEWIAGLEFNSKMICKIQMTKRQYLQGMMTFSHTGAPEQKLPTEQLSMTKTSTVIPVIHHEVVSETKQIPIVVKELVQKYDANNSNINSTNMGKPLEKTTNNSADNRKQPGSYPYGNKDSSKTSRLDENESLQKVPSVKKTFILYVPPVPSGWILKSVAMESEDLPLLNVSMKRRRDDFDLHEASVDLPGTFLERAVHFRYLTTWKNTSIVGKVLSPIVSTHFNNNSPTYFVGDSNVQRDIFESQKQKTSMTETKQGCLEHLADMLFSPSEDFNLSNVCFDLENFCRIRLRKEDVVDILKELVNKIQKLAFPPKPCFLFLVICGSLLNRPEILKINNVLNFTDAKTLMEAVQCCRISSLPNSCQTIVRSVCFQICRIIEGDGVSILAYLNLCYPLYGEEFTYQRIQDYVIANVSICNDSEKSLAVAGIFCRKLYDQAVLQSSLAKTIIETLLRHLPLRVALEAYSSLHKTDTTATESAIENVMYGSILAQIEKNLVLFIKTTNLDALWNSWKLVDKSEMLRHKFCSKYEDAMLKILESESFTGQAELVFNIVISSIESGAMFRDASKQQKLIWILVRSKKNLLNDLFLRIARCQVINNNLSGFSTEQFHELCAVFIIDTSSNRGRELSLTRVCERLGDIWLLPQMERKEFQETWEEVLNNEFQKYRIRELMQSLSRLNKLLLKHEQVKKVLLKYVEMVLMKETESFQPEEILKWLCSTTFRPRIENMLSAEVLEVVMISILPLSSGKELDNFLSLLRYAAFWQSIFACEGPYADTIRTSKHFQRAKYCIKSTVELFSTHNVSYDFVVDIENNAQKSRDFKQLMGLECQQSDVERLWMEALSKFKEEKDKLQRCRRVLAQVISKIGRRDLKEEASSLLQRLNDAENMLTTGKLTAKECIKHNLIWKDIEQIPSQCEYLEGVMLSDVYWNLCLDKALKEFDNAADDSTDPLEDLCLLFQELAVHNKDIQHFFGILSKSGKQIYKETWKELIENCKFKMNDVLSMFGKKPNIKSEFLIARKMLLCEIDETVEVTMERIYGIEKVKSTVYAVKSVLKAFGIELNEEFSSAAESFEQLRKGSASEFTFSDVRRALNTIYRSVEGLSEITIEIMLELGKSTTLIEFLQRIVDEDIRNLIDAVEDISEQQVRESTVSALIEVKRYVQPLLIPQTGRSCLDLIRMLETQTKTAQGNPKYLPAKVEDCMSHLHNLKSLYNNVANRGEQTKEMIKNIIQRGTFTFRLDSDSSSVKFDVVYKQNKNKETRQKTTLIDLRSRALLLKNSERKESEGQVNQDELNKFVDYIDLCLDIGESLFELYSSGNFEFMKVHLTAKPSELQHKKETLKSALSDWNASLHFARKTYFLLNYVNGTQIHELYKYLEEIESDTVAVQTMLRFIHPDLKILDMRFVYKQEKDSREIWNEESKLQCIGFTLHSTFHDLGIYERPITDDNIGMSTTITGKVKTSRLLVAQLEEGSIYTVKTVIALYINTTRRLPEPNQLLFCTRYTTWAEIDLHIRRCLGADSFYRSVPLFCIANVELLPNEIQFGLVDVLRHLDKKQKFLLAIVCRGSRSHPFIDELSEYVTSVAPASDKRMKQLFIEHCRDVLTITSDNAGQGKSSLIRRIAHDSNKGVIKLHISGPVRKLTLVERLLSLKIKETHLLHIDLGSVEDPTEVDTFLFELIVLRHVSAERLSFSLCIEDVKIEVGNTIRDSLRNSLQIAVLFQREHIAWRGINGVSISKEQDSSVQVVCRYLKGLDENTLDNTDFHTTSENASLSRAQCRFLLCKFIGDEFCVSFPIFNTFLDVLADQLRKMSNSTFFKVSRLRDMVGSKSPIAVKSKLVSAMLEMSKEFARRSVADCRESQMETMTTNSDKPKFGDETSSLSGSVVDRVGGMIRWEESNHLIFVFHNQNIQTLSALYRNLDEVENDIKFLFESQMKKKMDDFTRMDQRSLQNILQKVARCNPLPLQEEKLEFLAKGYALTADNLLKMVLIMLRVKSNVPVVIMGETGCGKTSLVRYLAAICEVPFDVLNIHAGFTEQDIINKVMECNDRAIHNLDSDLWLFLDEINTSESIGVVGDILCHHSCLGKDLSPNLVVMAACNPYRLRTSAAISTAGLDSKVKTDELSKLVYRVLPLPEMLVDFVWDFGALSEKDEEKYIYRMTDDVFVNDEEHHELFACLLTASQAFVRAKESSSYSVSLRDVQRCKTLTKWFMTILLEKNILNDTCEWDCDMRLKAMILSLAHCYHSRFADKRLRKEYRTVVAKVLALHKCVPVSEKYDEFFLGILKAEQRDILDRMELPPGTACNSALQENVFVILVCIFNRIPIFVVGKPGCSKSLAMQLIRSNLRGKDSKDDFFRTLPQLYCVSFQGSESSTSDGILKVFEKAEKYQQSNSREDVLSVVILDEIGLAEISRFNPLKVLHNLLEPDGKSQPNVAVVGISNWALDASKMNRAIHLSRTDMDTEELYETAISISRSFLEAEKSEALFEDGVFETAVSTKDIEGELYGVADAYTKYIEQMRFKNFHGLRDYYSLVKYIARMFAEKGSDLEDYEKADLILVGLERNFGGLPAEKQTLYDVFRRCMSAVPSSKNSVIDLITQNIQDPVARHMMLITTGEAMLGIVKQKLSEIGCMRKEVIYGSQFEEDLTDDYNYRILSRIILCMEEGIVLVLKDLESIYGSLYDMLNQNYTVIGKKKNCRVALGAYSNPICYVADSFRCIVLIEETKLDLSDPPFLNRFEKQYLRFSDILGEKDRKIITEIEKWMDDLASVDKPPVRKEDMFPIYDADMSASLVLKHTLDRQDATSGREKDIKKIMDDCLNELLWVIKPEVVVQLRSSSTFQYENSKANSIVSNYFLLPVHEGFDALLNYQMNLDEDLMCVVFTNCNVHTKVSELTGVTLQVEKLGAFKSEKQLSSRIQHFWDRDDCDVLVVQCNAKDDQRHILLTKLVIERNREEYLLQACPRKRKYVYLIIHLDRTKGEATCLPQLNFLSQWHLVMLDSIEKSVMPLPELCKLTLLEVVEQRRPLTNCLKDELFWAFTRIKYGSQSRDVESLSHIIDTIENSEEFLEVLDREIWEYIRNHMSSEENRNWQRKVAKDKMLLNTSTGLVDALERFVMDTIKRPLCKFIYKIELFGIADSFFDITIAHLPGDEKHDVTSQKRTTWLSLLHDASVFSIDDVPDESGPECYNCDTVHLGLKMPFSRYLFDSIESTKEDFLEVVRTYKVHCLLSEDNELPVEIYEEVLSQQEAFILQKMPDLKKFLYTNWTSDYLEDFCNIMSSRICSSLSELDRIYYAKLIVKQFCDVTLDDPFIFMSHLHTKCWVNQMKIRAELLFIEASLLVIPDVGSEIENILLPAKRTCLKSSASPQSEVIKTDDSSFQEFFVETQNGCRTSINDIEEGDVLYKSVTTPVDDIESKLKHVLEVDSQEANTFENFGIEVEDTETAIDLEFQNDSEIENENDKMERSTNWHDTEARAYIESTDTTSADHLVHFLCTNMLPSNDCIDVHSGIDCWVNKVMSALSLAYQVSHTPKILLSLRICCEIACELFIPYKLDVQLLTRLGNLLQNGCHLDEKEVSEAICKTIEAAREKHIENDVCMRLLSSYCVMCISADQDTNVLDFLFVLIEEGKIPQECTHLFKAPLLLALNLLDKSVLSDIILHGINPDPALTDVTCLSQESVEKDYQQEKVLLKIDEMIRNLFRNGGGPHAILVLITDIFQHLYLSNLNIGRVEDQQNQRTNVQNFDDEDRTPISEDPVNVLYVCHKIFNERTYGLQYVASVAYIKTFVSNVFEQGIDIDKEEFDRIMIPCETVISDEMEKMCSQHIAIFFLKAFMTGRTLTDVKKFTDLHQDIQFMKKYEWTPGYVESSSENSPLCMYLRRGIHEEYKSICHTRFEFSTFQEKVEALLDTATKDQQACLCAFSFAMKEFYLRKYMEPLDDTQRTLASYMCSTAIDKQLEGNSLVFLRKLTGEENFSLPELEMTEEIPCEQFCKVSFCTTWIATCLGSFQNHESSRRSVFIECLFAQISKKNILLPGFRKEERITDMQLPLDAPDEGWLVDCSCGSKMYCFGPSRIVTCIVCKANVDSWTPIHTSPEPAEGNRGVLSFNMDEICFGVRHLQPVACHLLRMLTIASLIGSFELGSTRKTLELLTGIAEFEVIEELWNNFQSHWGHLIELLNMDDNDLKMLLHVVVSHSRDLFFKTEAPGSKESLLAWEKEFEKTISPILDARYLEIQKLLIMNDRIHGFECPGFEQKLFEVDEMKHNGTEARLAKEIETTVEYLFRTNKIPTKTNFLSELYPKRNAFPCLSHVLENEARFKLPIHAINIINWHVATVSIANYVMKKNECLKMSVQDFIFYKQSADSSKSRIVLQRFDEFRKSWEVLKESLEDEELAAKMKHIHIGSLMSECLLLEENSVVKEVLSALLFMQNDCLDGMMKYASRTNALKFLFRVCDIAVIPSVQMTNLTPEDMICCNVDWDSLLLQESQCDLSYGQGKHIHYDFHNIEQAVAVAVFSGRSFVHIDDSLPKIVFLDELHMNYSSMIRDLQASIPQDSLPQEIANSIKMKKDDDPRMASQLLNQLGVVMTLLKKTKGDPDTPLIEYVDSWKSLLGREFPRKSLPSPETSIKLSHVVALNELLEELCADTMKNGMQDEFRIKLDMPLQGHLSNMFKDEDLTVTFLKAMKRFSFRCVLSKTADPNQMLRRYISDDSFWPLGSISNDILAIGEKKVCLSDIIPDGLMVHHTFACLSTIETELEKKRKENIKLTSFATSFNVKTKSSPLLKTTQKKKMATTFRKF